MTGLDRNDPSVPGAAALPVWATLGHTPSLGLAGLSLACLAAGAWTAGSPLALIPSAAAVASAVASVALAARRQQRRALEAGTDRLVEALRGVSVQMRRDPLTSLDGRVEFLERAAEHLARGPMALLIVDIDGFKSINDGYGPDAGDAALREVATRLGEACGPGRVLARLGGDEFGVLMPAASETDALVFANTLLQTLAPPIAHDERRFWLRACVGVALAAQGRSAQTLVQQADLALGAAKARGRGRVVAFEEALEARSRRQITMEREMKTALRAGDIKPYYQPILAADGVTILGAEALARWQHPVRGFISPAEFIPVAERGQFIVELGARLLRHAAQDAARWPEAYLSVNLSPVQIMHGDLVPIVHDVIRSTGLDPRRLVLEVTEGTLLEENARALQVLNELAELGVQVALDDFGTGYSSLAYLQRFRFDKLKVDQSFVAGLSRSADAATIIRSIVGLGRGLGMTVTAEGIETAAQQSFLSSAGCHEFQGYLFARPEPGDQFLTRLGGGVLRHDVPALLRTARPARRPARGVPLRDDFRGGIATTSPDRWPRRPRDDRESGAGEESGR